MTPRATTVVTFVLGDVEDDILGVAGVPERIDDSTNAVSLGPFQRIRPIEKSSGAMRRLDVN